VLITPLVCLFFFATAKVNAVAVTTVRTLGAKEPRPLEALEERIVTVKVPSRPPNPSVNWD
jgi:hypothetical protein